MLKVEMLKVEMQLKELEEVDPRELGELDPR